MRNIGRIYHAKGPLIKGILDPADQHSGRNSAAGGCELVPPRQMRERKQLLDDKGAGSP